MARLEGNIILTHGAKNQVPVLNWRKEELYSPIYSSNLNSDAMMQVGFVESGLLGVPMALALPCELFKNFAAALGLVIIDPQRCAVATDGVRFVAVGHRPVPSCF